MNKIEWTLKATRQLRRLPTRKQEKIRDAVNDLEDFRNNNFVLKLKSHRYDYRLRVGDYRVFFDHFQAVRIVSIEEVKKRDDRTY